MAETTETTTGGTGCYFVLLCCLYPANLSLRDHFCKVGAFGKAQQCVAVLHGSYTLSLFIGSLAHNAPRLPVIGVGDHAVVVEHATDSLLGPVPIGLLHGHQVLGSPARNIHKVCTLARLPPMTSQLQFAFADQACVDSDRAQLYICMRA